VSARRCRNSSRRLGPRSAWSAAAAAALAACAGPPPAGRDGEAPPAAPDYRTIAAAQNERVAGLRRVYGYGVLELRWQDERGVHAEPQVDVELWLDLPWRTALRVEKIGETLFWIGSDESSFWLFDLLNDDDRRAVLRDRGDEAAGAMDAFGLQPDSLLDLMAIRPLPAEAPPTARIGHDAARRAWVVAGLDAADRRRLYFDVATLRPVAVELLDTNGEVALESALNRYASVTTPGVSILAYPKQAMWIDITDRAGGGFAKLHLNEMTADMADQPLGSVFDLDRLMRNLRPDRVDGEPGRAMAGTGQ
jgi:hypothetical protein